jgi:hypothetical protein
MFQAPPDTIPAFVGAGGNAYGWGATAFDSSRSLPLNVILVTDSSVSGNDSGSYFNALLQTSDTTYDIIMFRLAARPWKTSGAVLDDSANKTLRHVYIAGQTAPGGGYIQTGQRLIWQSGAQYGNDVAMRYLSIYKVGSGGVRLCGDRMIYDHISAGLSGSGGSGNTIDTCERFDEPEQRPGIHTLQYSLASEAYDSHPTIVGFSGRLQSGHANFFAGPSRRLPIMSSDTAAVSGFSVVNNIVYNAGSPGGYHGRVVSQSVGDYRYNYVKPGPAVQTSPALRYAAVSWVNGCDTVVRYPQGCEFSLMYQGNRTVHNGYDVTTPMDTAWLSGNGELLCNPTTTAGRSNIPSNGTTACQSEDSLVPIEYRRDTPIWDSLGVAPYWDWSIRTTMSDAFIDSLLLDVGNSKGINCNGSFVDRRHPYDTLAIRQFQDSTGRSAALLYDDAQPIQARHPDSVPVIEYPILDAPCGMVGSGQGFGLYHGWLDSLGFDTTVAGAPPADSVTSSGYLLIEHMLNGSDPGDATPWATWGMTEVLSTFGAGRFVYFVPIQTLFGVRFPDYSPVTEIEYGILNPAEDSMMVVSCTQNVTLGAPSDSATTDARVAAWNRPGINTAVLVRDFTPFTGMAC